MTAVMSAHRAARSEPMHVLARWGLAARATVYLLIGLLALALAFGISRSEADQRGALQELARHTGGTVLLWAVAIGLAGYALWRFSEAAFGVVGDGKKAGPRLKSLARGLIYAFLAFSAFEIVTHSGTGSQAHQQTEWAGTVMRHPGGQWAVGIVGAIVVVCGLVLFWEGATRKFEKYLRMDEMSPATRRTVEFLGVVGSCARGVVFALAGVFVIVAAVQYEPAEAGGLDVALRKLDNAPAGPWLLVAVAIGLVMFGIYGFAEAKWRRV
jgi:Domain of Unknown Function (DUF1206)